MKEPDVSEKKMPRVRVAAIILHKHKILLAKHKKGDDTYWVPPGGGVDFGESLEEALRRELFEEADVHIRVGKLVMVHDSIPPDLHRHIVNIFFMAEIVSGEVKVGTDDKRLVGMKFVSLNKIPKLRLYPDVRAELMDIAQGKFADMPRYLGNLWRDPE